MPASTAKMYSLLLILRSLTWMLSSSSTIVVRLTPEDRMVTSAPSTGPLIVTSPSVVAARAIVPS